MERMLLGFARKSEEKKKRAAKRFLRSIGSNIKKHLLLPWLGTRQVYLLRASGILLPFYVVMRLICVIHQGQRQYRLHLLQV